MDGTLYRGADLFACTQPFLERLRRLGIGYTFLTNNTSRSKADYVAKLGRMGIAAAEGQIFTPVDSVLAYLRESLAGVRRLAVLGTPSLEAEFAAAGFDVTWEAPETVIVGFDTTLTYARLCRTAYWIAQGLPYLATHPDLVCPTEEATVLVDCGSICACLNAATGRQPVVFGKPDPGILLDVCRKLGIGKGEVLMCGDRLYTDIAMARRAGVTAVLVLSGEATAADAEAADAGPDMVVRDVGKLGEWLEACR
jgi:HAD superfamily hydrolase (TIGR01450 family)